MNLTLAKSLYVWAKGNPDNQQLLLDWLNTAIVQLADGSGKEVISVMGNGISTAFSSGQTLQDWINALSQAIAYLEKAPVSKVVGIFR